MRVDVKGERQQARLHISRKVKRVSLTKTREYERRGNINSKRRRKAEDCPSEATGCSVTVRHAIRV